MESSDDQNQQRQPSRCFVEVEPTVLVGKTIKAVELILEDGLVGPGRRGLDMTMVDGSRFQLRPSQNAGHDYSYDDEKEKDDNVGDDDDDDHAFLADNTGCEFFIRFQGGPFEDEIQDGRVDGLAEHARHPSATDLSVLVGHVVEDAAFFNVCNKDSPSSVYKALRLKLDSWSLMELRMEKIDYRLSDFDCGNHHYWRNIETINLLQLEEL